MADATYTPKVYMKQGGEELVVASGGSLTVESGGSLSVVGTTVTRLVSIADENTAISAANSGSPHVIANVSADRTFTLPTPASGLEYRFFPKLNAADGHDWIFDTGSNTNYFVGGVTFLDSDAGSGADELSLVAPDGDSNSKFQINLPQPGTMLHFICDGTLWVVGGVVCSTTAPAFADQ